MTINKNITIQGNGPREKVIIDAQKLSKIYTIGDNLNVTFINITFINANTTANGGAINNNYAGTTMTFINCIFAQNNAMEGGAIFNRGELNIKDSIIANNSASTHGGGLYITTIYSGSSNILIVNSSFINNIANSNAGGGIFVTTYPGGISNLIIVDSTFTNNTATNGGGMRIVAEPDGTANVSIINSTFIQNKGLANGVLFISCIGNSLIAVIIIDSNFTNNTSPTGGAIWINTPNDSTSTNVNISGSSFINNTANNGGAIWINTGTNGIVNVDITDSNFSNNIAANNDGGAILITTGTNGTANVNISGSSFINNTATGRAGGIYVISGTNGISNVNISGSSFINNTATDNGGGIYVINGVNGTSNVNITDSNFSNNIAANNGGGGILVSTGSNGTSNVNIIDSLFISNTANYGGGIYVIGISNVNISDSLFINNTANRDGGVIYIHSGNVFLSNNIMSGNIANDFGKTIYNRAGNIGVLNLTYLSNSTKNVRNGQLVTLCVVLTDDMGNFITGRNISFFFNGTFIGNVTVIEGNASLNYTVVGDEGDLFSINGSYEGIGDYELIINEGQLKIVKIATNSSVNASDIVIGEYATINGVAIDEDGNPLFNIIITVTINGIDYNVTTDANGEWTLTYIPTNYGNVNVQIYYAGNDTHYSFTNNTNFNVAKLATNATIIVSNATVGKSTIIRGVLVDENGNPINGASLNVVIGGKSYGVVTGTYGSWELPYTPSKAGNYNAKVYYNGDNLYLASTGSVAYTVAQEQEDTPKKTDIRLVKRANSKAVRHGNVVYMKWLTFKNFGSSGSQTVNAKVLYKNLKYKLWKVYNKKINYKFAKNNIKFKLNLKSNGVFKLKLKVYRPIK